MPGEARRVSGLRSHFRKMAIARSVVRKENNHYVKTTASNTFLVQRCDIFHTLIRHTAMSGCSRLASMASYLLRRLPRLLMLTSDIPVTAALRLDALNNRRHHIMPALATPPHLALPLTLQTIAHDPLLVFRESARLRRSIDGAVRSR
jgi:hypothetical protein